MNRSTMILGRRGPLPKDPEVVETVPTRTMFGAGVLRRKRTIPSERYWQAEFVTESGRIFFAYLDLALAERLTVERPRVSRRRTV